MPLLGHNNYCVQKVTAKIQPNESMPQNQPHKDHLLLGVSSGIAAFFLLAVMGAFAKLLLDNHNVVEIAFYRNALAVIPMLLYIAVRKSWHLFEVKNKPVMTARVIGGLLTLIITYAALDFLPLADATVIFMSSTLFVPVLAFLILGERIGPWRWLAVFVGFSGVILVAGPTGNIPFVGGIIALLAATGHAAIHIILRFLRDENAFTVTLYFMGGSAALTALALPFVFNMPQQKEWLWFAGVAISGGLAQYCLTTAMKFAPATVITPLNYTGLLWATGLDILIWAYVPGWPVFIGGAIIIGANVFIAWRERKARRAQLSPEESLY